jgi:hypothetical protein
MRLGSQRTSKVSLDRFEHNSVTSGWHRDYPKLFPVFTLKCRFFCSLVYRASNPLTFEFEVRVKRDFQMLANLTFFLLCNALPNSIVHFWVGPAKLWSGYCCLRSKTVAIGTPMTKLPNTLSPRRVSTRKYRFSRDIPEGWSRVAVVEHGGITQNELRPTGATAKASAKLA